ncbi:MAG: hypothetical protein SPE19_09385 [Candidatus Faecousia sp.]|nr:hypothetical protein [Candidatus Faecousia sp.]
MKPNSIVYTSNTGYTREYAVLLGEKTGLPVYSLEEADKKLAQGNTIVYLGWIMAGKVQGLAKASSRYHIAAVCGVGMGANGSQLEDVRRSNDLAAELPLFTLQGGFDIHRLRGVYKLMMTVVSKTLGKKLAEKKNRTPDEDDMLKLLTHGESRVNANNLNAVVDWYRIEE